MTQAPTRTLGTQAEFARAQGWERSYVTKLKQQGRLVITDDGLVDFEASLERIRQTTQALERAAPAVQGVQFADARSAREYYEAELKRLEYEAAVGKLLRTDDVDDAVADVSATYRAGIEALVERLPAQIVALGGDEARIRALLRDEGEHLLRRVSERLARLAREDPAP
ncbi:MAG: hypothetical protein N2688_00520 [Burkholderiaceae bacterium]|jgi:hypothetical protein|nr:hypothetical protein [Burkholderiaceae bacterium]